MRKAILERFSLHAHVPANIDRTCRAALSRGTIVRKKHDCSVLHLASGGQVVDQPSNLIVGVREKARVCLLQFGTQCLLLRRQ